MNNKAKKAIAFVTLSILLTSLYKYEKAAKPKYAIVEEQNYFATYSKGRVFIGSKEYLISIREEITPNDIIVIDQRNGKDPNLKIISSYRIKDSRIRDEIIRILLQYETKYPSKWKRSIKTMRREWLVHNLLYKLNVELDRTKDVDFNNEDEITYRIRKKHRILK